MLGLRRQGCVRTGNKAGQRCQESGGEAHRSPLGSGVGSAVERALDLRSRDGTLTVEVEARSLRGRRRRARQQPVKSHAVVRHLLDLHCVFVGQLARHSRLVAHREPPFPCRVIEIGSVASPVVDLPTLSLSWLSPYWHLLVGQRCDSFSATPTLWPLGT